MNVSKKNKINVLDCTLRDGGYCNNWMFGKDNVKKVIQGLEYAKVDIIECGFLSSQVEKNVESTQFVCIEDINRILKENQVIAECVLMINYGEFNVEDLPKYTNCGVKGIRVAFHKSNRKQAIKVCKEIKDKGYDVYVQPMLTISYSEEEFEQLIELCNQLQPKALYIVDSFGYMKNSDLKSLIKSANRVLSDTIAIGFHGHNNMQLVYSNAQTIVELELDRELIIDTSVMGMGRGAGNLNTELFVEYLNETRNKDYKLEPILTIIDEIVNDFYLENAWGYSVANYLSAKYATHPNYAQYLDDKRILTIKDMNNIFSKMDDEKRLTFNRKYADDIYLNYMKRDTEEDIDYADLKSKFIGKEVLVIAPGKSAKDDRETIIKFVKDKAPLTVEVNFDYPYLIADYLFLNNARRYHEVEAVTNQQFIVTSNLSITERGIRICYEKYLNDHEYVRDNALLMLIKFLIEMNAKKVYLAGVDGYSYNENMNYIEKSLKHVLNNYEFINQGIKEQLELFSEKIEIEFITKPRYLNMKIGEV